MTNGKMTNSIGNNSQAITPFRVEIPQDELDDLRRRLRNARYPQQLPGDGWDTGIPLSYLRSLASSWAEFDWPNYQARLNQVPQFTTTIDGQVIHFLHVRSAVPHATPLVLTHGWPGSVLEFIALLGPLTDPVAHGGRADDAFDVVIPSLPGFGFSTPLASAGWTTRRIAEAWVELMDRLGYDRFVVQGGDIGAGVAPEVGRVDPGRVIGVHINGTSDFIAEVDEETEASLTDLERDRLRRTQEFMQKEFGYIALQSTRPGLVGEMLTDSPLGQLAWIVDKLRAWTYPLDTPAEDVVGLDFLLANVSLYWFTGSAGSAAYVGYAQEEGWGNTPANSGVPTAVLCFAHDIGIRRFNEKSNTIVRWNDFPDRGGHFAALEEPEILVDDLREFVRSLADSDSGGSEM